MNGDMNLNLNLGAQKKRIPPKRHPIRAEQGPTSDFPLRLSLSLCESKFKFKFKFKFKYQVRIQRRSTMSFHEYRNYSPTQLEAIFKVKILADGDLFTNFTPEGKDYPELQARVDMMESRISISKDAGNEATRGSLLVSHTLWEAVAVYDLGIFFEPPVEISREETPDLPHQLNGKYDCAVNLNIIDFISPVVAVVEVKPTQIASGLGQCLAEMYATLKQFRQNHVYEIITDGEVWKFLSLENSVLTVDKKGYHISHVAGIVDRIGYIAERFRETE